jgi:hypothetical protein
MTISWACSEDFELTAAGACGAPTLRPTKALEQRLALDLSAAPAGPPQMELGVHLHAFYPEEARRILGLLHASLPACDLLITTDTLTKQRAIFGILEELSSPPWQQRVEVRIVPNRGRNILPMLRDGVGRFRDHELFLHLHTKRTTHHDFGSDWLEELLNCLIGKRDRVWALMQAFQQDPDLGLVMPQPPRVIRPFVHWGANFAVATLLVNTVWRDRNLEIAAPLVFPPGMMFWARPQALLPLADAVAAMDPLPLEPLLHDGTPLHAIERLTAHACEVAGMHWALATTTSAPAASSGTVEATGSQRLSVWQAQPQAYIEGVAGLAKSQRELQERLAERDRQLKAIMDHRDSLEVSLAERDRGLAERDAALEASRHELMAAINGHHQDLEVLLAERDRSVSEHRATLEAARHEILLAIAEQQKTIETSIAERESTLKSHLIDLEDKQQDLKKRLHNMVDQLDKLLEGDALMIASREEILAGQERLRNNQEILLSNQEALRGDQGLVRSNQERLLTNQEALLTSHESLREHQELIRTNQDRLLSGQEVLWGHQEKFQANQQILQAHQQRLLNNQETLQGNQESFHSNQKVLQENQEKLLEDQHTHKQSLEIIIRRHRDLQESLNAWEQALARRDSAFQESCEVLIETQRNHWRQLQAILEQGERLEASITSCNAIVHNLETERQAMRATYTWRLREALRHNTRKLIRSLRLS